MPGRVERSVSRLARLWGALSLTPVFSFTASAIAVASAITDRYPATFTAVIVAIGGTGFAVTLNKAVRDALLPIASLLSSISGALLAIVFGLSLERPGMVDSSLAVLGLVSLGSALGVVSAGYQRTAEARHDEAALAGDVAALKSELRALGESLQGIEAQFAEPRRRRSGWRRSQRCSF